MNPIKVFLSIFVAGLALTFVLAGIGISFDPESDVAQEPKTGNGGNDALAQLPGDAPNNVSNCLSCHGQDLTGGVGPSLRDIDLSKEEIVNILVNGRGSMPGGLASGNEEVVAEYLLSIKGQ